jgi:predicted MFS family arabinose efflux permease
MTGRDIRLLGLVAFASMASMRVCDPMLVQWATEFDVSQGQASHVIAVFAIAYGVMQLVYGPLGQRLGNIRLVTWAAGISAVLSVLTLLSSGLEALTWVRTAMGAIAAGIIPLSMAWIGDKVGYEERQQTLARLMSATVTGLMAGQWFGGFAAQYLGWRWAFAALAVLFASSAFLLFRSAMYQGYQPQSDKPTNTAAMYLQETLQLLQQAIVQKILLLTLLDQRLWFERIVCWRRHVVIWCGRFDVQPICQALAQTIRRSRFSQSRRRVDRFWFSDTFVERSYRRSLACVLSDWARTVYAA